MGKARTRSHPAEEEITAARLQSLRAEEWASIMAGPPAEVARWIEAAADHGFRTAQIAWGQMLLEGRGVARDPAGALAWFRRAAELGSAEGENMVGRCHELGWGVAVDHDAALAWYARAAERGSAWGQYNLAGLLLYGEVARDPAQALAWYEEAARQGHAKAMGMIGRFHEEGWAGSADLPAAFAWYARAAQGGDFWGQYHLARLLAGSGRAAEALPWLARAVEGGTRGFLNGVAPDLLAHPDPAFREIGRRARERAGQATAGDRPWADALALPPSDPADLAAEAAAAPRPRVSRVRRAFRHPLAALARLLRNRV